MKKQKVKKRNVENSKEERKGYEYDGMVSWQVCCVHKERF